jgi:hypothetical protein
MSSYYHGGQPGLTIGDRVLPPALTGEPTTASRDDRVYLAREPAAAVVFAAFHRSGNGGVYQVEPEQPIERDEDWQDTGESIQAPSATVTAILDPARVIYDFAGVNWTLADVRRSLSSLNQFGLVR